MRSLKIDLSSMGRVKFLAGAALVAGLVAVSNGAASDAGQHKSGSETGLVGITLYDSGVKLISKFGSPDEIEAVSLGGTGGGAGGAGGGAGGAAGFPGSGGGGGSAGAPPLGGGRRPAPGAGPGAPTADFTGPVDPSFDFADAFLGQGPKGFGGAGVPQGPPPVGGGGQGRTNGPPAGFGGAGVPGAPGGFGGGKNGPAGGAGGSDTRTVFTRWIYKRDNSKYGFVLDKFNRIVQIEAIGLSNPKVYTKRGIRFGNQFGTIIKKYAKNPDGAANQPDGYEINGNTVVVRYLVKNKVAFKLSRLGKDKPYVVTGIVVAAGKL
jgi:hypothetical protein